MDREEELIFLNVYMKGADITTPITNLSTHWQIVTFLSVIMISIYEVCSCPVRFEHSTETEVAWRHIVCETDSEFLAIFRSHIVSAGPIASSRAAVWCSRGSHYACNLFAPVTRSSSSYSHGHLLAWWGATVSCSKRHLSIIESTVCGANPSSWAWCSALFKGRKPVRQ